MKRIAIIGSGIAGLSCAYYLDKYYDIYLIEKKSYLGGHAHTEYLNIDNQEVSIDTGFMVYNEVTYPKFTRLLKQLNIKKQVTDMSFSVSCLDEDFEYNGSTLNSLFAQRSHCLQWRYYQFLYTIAKFNRQVLKDAQNQCISSDMTIAEYVEGQHYSSHFCERYLIPIAASIWSAKPSEIMNMPMKFFADFFASHGLLNIFNRPQWYTLVGGCQQYVQTIALKLRCQVLLNHSVKAVNRESDTCGIIFEDGNQLEVDKVILATHADQALQILSDPTQAETSILSKFPYVESSVALHTDTGLMPRRKLAWASWNYQLSNEDMPTLTYYLNQLQNIQVESNLLLTLNQTQRIQEDKLKMLYNYSHPVFNKDAIAAQQQYAQINANRNTYYCGAYWHSGFHEDGIRSALSVCSALGVEVS